MVVCHFRFNKIFDFSVKVFFYKNFCNLKKTLLFSVNNVFFVKLFPKTICQAESVKFINSDILQVMKQNNDHVR